MIALPAVGVVLAEGYSDNFTETNGAALQVESGQTIRVSGATFENNVALGKGGAIYVEGGGILQMHGAMRFSENYESEVLEEGAPKGWGVAGDVYLESGATLAAGGATANQIYVSTAADVVFSMRALESTFTLSSATITSAGLSGTFGGVDIVVDSYKYGEGERTANLQNITLEGSMIFCNSYVSVVASGISLDATSTLTGSVVLSGSNALTLSGIRSNQLHRSTLADGAVLHLELSEDMMLTDGEQAVAISLVGLKVADGAEVAFAASLGDTQFAVTGYTVTDSGVVVSVTSIPEPATSTLSLLALAALAVRRRRV